MNSHEHGHEHHPEHHHGHSFEIVVNAEQHPWNQEHITYQQVVELAFPGSAPTIVFTVSYAVPHGPEGTLTVGQEARTHNHMVFNVIKTNRS